MNNFTAFRMFLCVLFAGFALSAAAQGQTVTGVVSGTDGQPLPGVTVIEPVSYTHLTLPTNREV